MHPRSSLSPITHRVLPVVATFIAAAGITPMNARENAAPRTKILFVLTSHDRIEKTGAATGFYLSEVTHPWAALIDAGYEVEFVSPKGGEAPVDALDLTDPINRRFWDHPIYRAKITRTMRPSEIDPNVYRAIHYAGGHGAMWDLADNAAISEITARIYASGGIVSAVCHGPAGLVNVKLPNGRYLVEGRKVNAFTNEEEAAVQLNDVVPFLLETTLVARGAVFEKSAPFLPHAVVDQRLITGQNPQSAKAVGEALVEQLAHLNVIGRLTRYAVKPTSQETFQAALSTYVARALVEDANIQAEAYHERDDRSALWLIERWKSREELARFERSEIARAIESLRPEALLTSPEIYQVTDLEPLSKAQWRRPARAEDTPLTIMLFVDAQPGTQDVFRDVYHRVMPAFRSEPGVVTYQLSQIAGDKTKFVTFEKFRSDAAFAYHLNFPPIQPVIDYLNTSIKRQPFQDGLRTLIEFAPLRRETAGK